MLRRLRHLDLDQRCRRGRDRAPRRSHVTMFSTAFAGAARKQAAGRGMAKLPLARIPHPMHTAPRDVVLERADAVVDTLVDRLTKHADAAVETDAAEAFSGANDVDDQELFFDRGWTDGLPVVIPTAEKVAAMVAASEAMQLMGSDRFPPRWRQATIEKIAVNAVMAGCRPEYFPVVLAAIDAALDDNCQLYGIQTATNTTAPLFIVNGPLAAELDINARGNVYGQGARAECHDRPRGAARAAQYRRQRPVKPTCRRTAMLESLPPASRKPRATARGHPFMSMRALLQPTARSR